MPVVKNVSFKLSARLLEAALESEGKLVTLKPEETYEELIRCSVTGDATPGHAHG